MRLIRYLGAVLLGLLCLQVVELALYPTAEPAAPGMRANRVDAQAASPTPSPRPTGLPPSGQSSEPPADQPTSEPTGPVRLRIQERFTILTPEPTPPSRQATRNTATDGRTTAPLPLPLSHRFTPQQGDIVTRVERGVYHIRRATRDPLKINILLFDITAPEFDVKTALGDDWLSGRTQTSYMVRQNGALAGVNGDLFSGRGDPQGLTMIDSRIVKPPKRRATFAWSHDREPLIGYFTDHWTWDADVVTASGARRLLNEFNPDYTCPTGHLCLFNEFVRVAPAYWGDVKVLIGPSGRVFDVVESGGAVAISDQMRVLQGVGEGAEWLLDNVAISDTLDLVIGTNYPLSDYSQAISGGPIIVDEGAFFQDCLCKLWDCSYVYFPQGRPEEGELLCEDFDTWWKETHYEYVYMPRTAVGYDKWKQTLIVIVVDGYQWGYSRGILQTELADLFLEFGAHMAMELDGGGSTTMVLDGKIMNNPSDPTGERYVSNGLLFFWNENPLEPQYPASLRPPAWRLPAQRPR